MTFKKLTEKEKAFIKGYCGAYKFNGTQSAIAAGYSEKSACEIASENLRKPHIAAGIQERLQQQAFEYDELTRQIIAEYTKIAFADYTKLAKFDSNAARFASIEDVPDDIRSCIKKIKNTESGIEIELHSKEKALSELAKITGLSVETKKVVGEDYETLIERLTKK